MQKDSYTAAFTYYYDPVILQNKLTPLTIFRDLSLRKRDSKNFQRPSPEKERFKKVYVLLLCVL